MIKPPPVEASPSRDDLAKAAPPVILSQPGESATPSNLAAVVPNADAGQVENAEAPPVTAGFPIDATANVASIEPERMGGTEGQRPSAPTAVAEKGRSWPWLAVAVVLGIVLSIAAAAIVMRQKPQDLAITPSPEPQQEASQSPAKIAQRAQPSPAEDTVSGAAPTPSFNETQANQVAPNNEPNAHSEAQATPVQLPTAARAAMLIASPDNPQKPVVNLGSTVWSTIPAAPGQPATIAVKAEADIPDLKLHATMTLRKNTDPTLEATHTIDLKFAFADGAPITGFKDVGLPQMRKLDFNRVGDSKQRESQNQRRLFPDRSSKERSGSRPQYRSDEDARVVRLPVVAQ